MLFRVVLALVMSIPGWAGAKSEGSPPCDIVVAQDGSGDYERISDAITAATGDTALCIRSGRYDLDGFSKTIKFDLGLIGEDPDSTILTDGGTLELVKSLRVENLTFANYRETIFRLTPAAGQVQDGVLFRNNVFRDTKGILRDDFSQTGSFIQNVRVVNNKFTNLRSPGGIKAIALAGEAGLKDIVITNNAFTNLRSISNKKYAIAVMVGNNITRDVNENIDISCNVIDGVIGGTAEPETGNDYPETHGVFAFGENITVANNVIRNINQNRDHEAIYLKASNARIINNVVEDGGAYGGAGDITIKGGANDNNVIAGNRITGAHIGNAIYANGESVIEGNYIRKPNGRTAIRVYGYGKRVVIRNNEIYSRERSLHVVDAVGGEISGNAMDGTIDIDNSEVTENNNVYLSSKERTDRNFPIACRDSCASSEDTQADSTCVTICCEESGGSVGARGG